MSIVLCECGCGQPAPIATQNNAARGYVKGQPQRFIRGHAAKRLSTGKYLHVYRPSRAGHVLNAHIAVAETALGKPLPSGADVHHVDGNARNNSGSNLVICQDRAYHMLLHVRTRVRQAGGNPNTDRLCTTCMRPQAFGAFHKDSANLSNGLRPKCRACQKASDRARYLRKRAAREATA